MSRFDLIRVVSKTSAILGGICSNDLWDEAAIAEKKTLLEDGVFLILTGLIGGTFSLRVAYYKRPPDGCEFQMKPH